MPSTTRILFHAAWLIAALASGCGGRGDRPAGASPGVATLAGGADPRATGLSEFTSMARPRIIPHGGGPPTQSLFNERPVGPRQGATSAVVGSTLYALSSYRGLQVVQIGDPPERGGRVPILGDPHALFVAGPTALAVMSNHTRTVPCAGCPGQERVVVGSLVAAADVRDPGRPVLSGTLVLDGQVLRAHLEGPRLYLLLRQGDAWAPLSDGVPGTTLVSIDVGQPSALREVARLEIATPKWVDEIQFAPGVAYLGVYGRQFWTGDQCAPLTATTPRDADGCTRLQAVDLATLRTETSLDLRGRLFPGSTGHHQGVLRALLISSRSDPGGDRLVTLATTSAAQLTPLGTLDLPGGRSSNEAVRFDGPRAYLQSHGFLIVDLGRPDQPVLGGRLPGVGRVATIFGATGTRLVTGSVEALPPPCARPELAIFDVQDVANPRLLSRQIGPLRMSPAGTALAEGDDLLLLPYSLPREPVSLPQMAVQLFDVDLALGTLGPRGQTPIEGRADRIVRVDDRAVLLSRERAQVLDVRDRDRPALLASIELQRRVTDFELAGETVVQVVEDDDQQTFRLVAAPASDPDGPFTTATAAFGGRAGPLFSHGPFLYLFWSARGAAGEEPRLAVLELEGGRLQARASLSLAGPAPIELAGVPDQDGFAQQVRQVGGSTFLVPVRRVRNCTVRPPLAGNPAPGCGDTGNPPPPPPAPAAVATQTMPLADCPGSDADFLVVDASSAEAPRIASRFRLQGDGEFLGALARERTVLVTQRERTRQPGGTELLRHFVTEVRLDDPTSPIVGGPVNVPGGLVSERAADRTWITVEPTLTGVAVNVLYRDAQSDRAFLQRKLAIDGAVSGPVTGGDTMFFTVDGQLVAVDPFAPGGPRIRSRTPVLDAAASGDGGPFGSGRPSVSPGDPPVYPIPANVHRLVGGHVFVLLRHSVMLIFDARDPDRPRRLDRFVGSRERSPVLVAPGNRAIIGREDGWGLEMVDLPDP